MKSLYDNLGNKVNLLENNDFEVIENSSGDVFLKYPNGILEIYFYRSLEFSKNGIVGETAIFLAPNIQIPNDIPLVKGISLSACSNSAGTDIAISGINNYEFRNQANNFKIQSLYIIVGDKNVDALTNKIIDFHVIGKWK